MNAFDNLVKLYDFIRPLIDIGIIAFLLYKAYGVLKKTNSVQIIRSAIIVGFAYVAALLFRLSTLQWLLNILAQGLLICFAIVFQPELRKIFIKIGQINWFSFRNRSKHSYVDAVLMAADQLSKLKRGMLVVFLRRTRLDDIIENGTKLNADLSSNLLLTIFAFNTTMHDGACIVQGGKVLSAGCFLPLSEQYDIKKTFGTRHRAALGISEVSDAVVLVVSEESGAISLAYESRLHYDLSMEELTQTLEDLLDIKAEDYTLEDTIDESESAKV